MNPNVSFDQNPVFDRNNLFEYSDCNDIHELIDLMEGLPHYNFQSGLEYVKTAQPK